MNSATKSFVAKTLFGANLAEQGRGFWVAMELFALLRGSYDASRDVLPDGDLEMRLDLRSHDFARRLAVAAHSPESVVDDIDALDAPFDRVETRQILSSLMESLVLPIPGRRAAPTFKQTALYPYIGELVHYDAVDRRRRGGGRWISIERNTSRGAGGLAHRILRSDPDVDRLGRNRSGLSELVADSGSSLGRLMDALGRHDGAEPSARKEWVDDEEKEANPHTDVAPRWSDHLRSGVDRILRSGVPAQRRVDRLMFWVPYCVARLQGDLADARIGSKAPVIPLDLRDRPSSLRGEARLAFDRRVQTLNEALSRCAADLAKDATGERRVDLEELAVGRPWKVWVTFHVQTLAACGAVNATTGLRHYTAKLPFLEALVGATLEPREEMPFEEFCRVVSERYGLVVDELAARGVGLLDRVDAREFEENATAFQNRIRDLGLLAEYSDQTRLVRAMAA